MFKLHQIRPEGSDCTAPYDVELNGEYTVEQFVKDVLLNNREWGYIGIDNGSAIFGDPKCEYRYGTLTSRLPDEYLKLRVVAASAHGGWSRMDYILTVEPANTEVFPVTEHYGMYKENIYGDAWFVVCRLPKEEFAKFKTKEAALNECPLQYKAEMSTLFHILKRRIFCERSICISVDVVFPRCC